MQNNDLLSMPRKSQAAKPMCGVKVASHEATRPIEDDPNLTDRKFPGNPTKSYRSQHPFRVVGEITIWKGHPEEQVKAMKDALDKLKEQGIDSLNDE